MLSFAPAYLLYRLAYRIVAFLRHWYLDGSKAFGRRLMATLESLDRTFAVVINFRHLGEPLYGDYTFIGRLLGPLFRLQRVAMGLIIYLVIGVLFLAAYLLWLMLPVGMLVYAMREFLI